MADNQNQSLNFGTIFRRYVGLNQKGNRVKIPVLCGSPSHFVNCFLTEGETIDLISALEDALKSLRKEVIAP